MSIFSSLHDSRNGQRLAALHRRKVRVDAGDRRQVYEKSKKSLEEEKDKFKKEISDYIEKVDKDNTEEITKKVKEILSENWFTRRLVKAFPNFIYIGKVIKENAIRIITKEQQEEEKIRIDTEAKIKKMKIDYEYRVSKLREKANMKIEKIKKKKKEK